jgi:hypothetical protein
MEVIGDTVELEIDDLTEGSWLEQNIEKLLQPALSLALDSLTLHQAYWWRMTEDEDETCMRQCLECWILDEAPELEHNPIQPDAMQVAIKGAAAGFIYQVDNGFHG